MIAVEDGEDLWNTVEGTEASPARRATVMQRKA
jgi:hypothetical protein